ncbi:hypothetical protein [Inquilinus limosus]|uniref:hypothetical protein n=1 Tax=Inquilinus limosus TaxID=171674 RepID=UPI00047E9CD2|nr:hypothetical protein [Inquilinus limosus]
MSTKRTVPSRPSTRNSGSVTAPVSALENCTGSTVTLASAPPCSRIAAAILSMPLPSSSLCSSPSARPTRLSSVSAPASSIPRLFPAEACSAWSAAACAIGFATEGDAHGSPPGDRCSTSAVIPRCCSTSASTRPRASGVVLPCCGKGNCSTSSLRPSGVARMSPSRRPSSGWPSAAASVCPMSRARPGASK